MGMRKQSFLVCSWIFVLSICAVATERQSNADYRARRVALAKQMEGGTLVLFAPTEAEGQNDLYGFRQDDNFYYLTGFSEPNAILLLDAASEPAQEFLFLPERKPSEERWTGPKLGPGADAEKATGFAKVLAR